VTFHCSGKQAKVRPRGKNDEEFARLASKGEARGARERQQPQHSRCEVFSAKNMELPSQCEFRAE